MVDRIRIGELFGEKGVFVSYPGKNVTVPGSQLLMDTRFDYLQIHQAGRFDLDVTDSFGDGNFIYFSQWFKGSVDFPSLGYEPLVYASLTFKNPQGRASPNLGWYPVFPGWADSSSSGIPVDAREDISNGVVQCGYYLELANTRLTYRLNFVYFDNHVDALEINVDYIIFKNPAV